MTLPRVLICEGNSYTDDPFVLIGFRIDVARALQHQYEAERAYGPFAAMDRERYRTLASSYRLEAERCEALRATLEKNVLSTYEALLQLAYKISYTDSVEWARLKARIDGICRIEECGEPVCAVEEWTPGTVGLEHELCVDHFQVEGSVPVAEEKFAAAS